MAQILAGSGGTFVISWAQTQLDGQWNVPPAALAVGAQWSWTGEAVRLDGPAGVELVPESATMADLRRRAAGQVRRLLRAVSLDAAHPANGRPTAPPAAAQAMPSAAPRVATLGTLSNWRPELPHLAAPAAPPAEPLFETGFCVTDGRATWVVTLIDVGPHHLPLVMVMGALPPRHTDLWVVSHNLDRTARSAARDQPGGVICFTPGTMILTDTGPRPVEGLVEGDRVQTKDNGPAPILWIGRRRISGARIHAMPHLAPIRLREGALDRGVPDAGLLVSPDHRLVLRGPRAQALFNTAEVLVTARDLVNDRSVVIDRNLREVTYIHLLLPCHEIVFANAVETESFHPASAALSTMEDGQLMALLHRLPAVADDPMSYGHFARRVLSHSEAAILGHDLAA